MSDAIRKLIEIFVFLVELLYNFIRLLYNRALLKVDRH